MADAVSIPGLTPAVAAGYTAKGGARTIAYDADVNGTNESTAMTDDPAAGGAADPTTITVGGVQAGIPTLNEVGLILLAVLLALGGAVVLRRRRTSPQPLS